MIPIGKIVILSFSNSEEHILHEIMQIIRMQPEFQIRDMVLNDEILDFGKLIINPLKRNAEKNGQEIKLTLYEFEILYLLARNPGWVFSKAQIYGQIWKEPYYQAYDSVMHIIYNLRSKIEDDRKRPSYILTVRGFGYKFNPAYYNVGEEALGRETVLSELWV